jgi:transcriptional regulator GlxA family with amidase domain
VQHAGVAAAAPSVSFRTKSVRTEAVSRAALQRWRVVRTARLALSEIALAGGFYDQAHFINDFRSFTGQTPAAWHWTKPARRPSSARRTCERA